MFAALQTEREEAAAMQIALADAAKEGKDEVVGQLLKAKADAAYQDENGRFLML